MSYITSAKVANYLSGLKDVRITRGAWTGILDNYFPVDVDLPSPMLHPHSASTSPRLKSRRSASSLHQYPNSGQIAALCGGFTFKGLSLTLQEGTMLYIISIKDRPKPKWRPMRSQDQEDPSPGLAAPLPNPSPTSSTFSMSSFSSTYTSLSSSPSISHSTFTSQSIRTSDLSTAIFHVGANSPSFDAPTPPGHPDTIVVLEVRPIPSAPRPLISPEGTASSTASSESESADPFAAHSQSCLGSPPPQLDLHPGNALAYISTLPKREAATIAIVAQGPHFVIHEVNCISPEPGEQWILEQNQCSEGESDPTSHTPPQKRKAVRVPFQPPIRCSGSDEQDQLTYPTEHLVAQASQLEAYLHQVKKRMKKGHFVDPRQ
jgi:hypothetical protein